MAEEFVDLYEVLGLPLDAERGVLRKRINELYLDAQRNIDHRHFATRIKFQELFEVTLPQARYILLDDGRRDEYNRLVNTFRSTGVAGGGSVPAPATPVTEEIPLVKGGFSLANEEVAMASNTPLIEPVPEASMDAAQLALEREELWKKWKSGLEAALTVDGGDKPKARGAVTSVPTSFSAVAKPDVAPAPTAQAPTAQAPTAEAPVAATPVAATPVANPIQAAPAPNAAPGSTSKAPPRHKVEIDFNFGDSNAPWRGDSAPAPGAEEIVSEHKRQHTPEEIEARRVERRRQITKEILVNVGFLWSIIGALIIVVPGITLLIVATGHYYPRSAAPLLGYPSLYLWLGGLLVMGLAAFFASRELSKIMRRKKAIEISLLSYEEVLRQHGKTS